MRDTAAREGRHGVTGFGNESIQFSKNIYIYIYIPGPPPPFFFLYIEVFVEVLRRIEQQQPFPIFLGGGRGGPASQTRLIGLPNYLDHGSTN